MQLLFKATRIQGCNFSLIDHICSKNETDTQDTGIITSDISDHFPSFITLKGAKIRQKHKTIQTRCLTKPNISLFKNALDSISWDNVKIQTDVNTAFDEFWNTFHSLFEIYLPLRTQKLNRNIHKLNNFLTTGLLTSRKTKNALHKNSILFPTLANLNKYRNYRNLYNTLLRKSKNLFYHNKLQENAKNPKKNWETLNEIIGKKSCNKKISEINNDNGLTLTNDIEIAERFNDFFSSIGQKISDSISKTDTDPLSYLKHDPNIPQLKFDEITPTHINDMIKQISPKKSLDIDGISNFLLSQLNDQISVPLAYIFNISLKTGTYPNKFKTSRVIPIFKSGDHLLADNYRPISLVSSIAKILDKIVAIGLTNHLELNKLLYPFQFGFQKKSSTELNLLHMSNFISSALNSNKYCIGVFLDLKKAFDVVPHELLLKKLNFFGITGKIWEWFQSYLKGRAQKVEINGKLSNLADITISVLQGSILGPILFLCFINDLPSISKLFLLLFADDTSCLSADSNLQNLITTCNNELQKIANWMMANKLAINVKKCKFIIFHNKGKKVHLENLTVNMNMNEIGKENDPQKIIPLDRITFSDKNSENHTYKYLGILLDEYFSLSNHIEYIGKKLSKGLFCLNRVKNFIPKKSLKILYFSMFHSHLLYCSLILGCATNNNISKLITLQKKQSEQFPMLRTMTTQPHFF